MHRTFPTFLNQCRILPYVIQVNYPPLKRVGFPSEMFNMSRTLNNPVIGTQGCIYRHPTLRNLDRINYCLDSMAIRPQSDVDRGIPVGIAGVTATTFEQCLCLSVEFADTSTLIASFACIFGVNLNNLNLFSDGYVFDGGEQFEVRYSVDLPVGFFVELPSLGSTISELLNGDTAVELFCQSYNLPCSLEALGSGIVGFISFDFSQTLPRLMRTPVSNALQFAPPFVYSPLFMADFPSQIELLKYPSILNNGYSCQVRRTNIYTQDTFPSNWFREVLPENGLNYPITVLFKEHNRLKYPAIVKERDKSLPSAILSDWQSEPPTFDKSDDKHRVFPFSLAKPVISFSKADSNFFELNIKHLLFLAPDLTPCGLDNLRRETSFFANRGIRYAM